ncbi:hypothetical protein [Lysobacter gummosus]
MHACSLRWSIFRLTRPCARKPPKRPSCRRKPLPTYDAVCTIARLLTER